MSKLIAPVLALAIACVTVSSVLAAPAVPKVYTAVSGHTLSVSGTGWLPASSGHPLTLWIDYPGDYQQGPYVTGFYDYPVVAENGTFSASYVLPAASSGKGSVTGIQWSIKRQQDFAPDTATYLVAP